ncbi:uncharacterized protein LOC111273661 isoform X3 [Varroa jacobsoni]|nr:uncharacterized protein LOC111273661 isoform X3 [Varroa jacobsoni]XP_022711214.1 uncharacterized protein LOC111273661 isoform X3 [Varroa jacobsoni]
MTPRAPVGMLSFQLLPRSSLICACRLRIALGSQTGLMKEKHSACKGTNEAIDQSYDAPFLQVQPPHAIRRSLFDNLTRQTTAETAVRIRLSQADSRTPMHAQKPLGQAQLVTTTTGIVEKALPLSLSLFLWTPLKPLASTKVYSNQEKKLVLPYHVLFAVYGGWSVTPQQQVLLDWQQRTRKLSQVQNGDSFSMAYHFRTNQNLSAVADSIVLCRAVSKRLCFGFDVGWFV